MRKQVYVLALLLLILSTNIAFGDGNKTKATTKTPQKNKIKDKATDRTKRSTNYDETDEQLWTNRGKRPVLSKGFTKHSIDLEDRRKLLNLKDKSLNEPPFWGNRGRRSSEEIYNDLRFTDISSASNDYDYLRTQPQSSTYPNLKDRREDSLPFWGNRGRRNSDEIPVDNDVGPFWSSRGRRQEDEPFWGTRGRRENNLPFWSSWGRREDEPFWGNRGRREENEPFWGNRGRRQDEEPFWGNRGKKEDVDPFWGNRGKKEVDDSEPFWGNRGRRKEDLKESILEAINKVENDIDFLARLKRGGNLESSGHFWTSRGRDSQLKYLFDGTRLKNQHEIGDFKSGLADELTAKPSVSSTLLDNRMFVDEPHYIVVERSSRSSAELDPYFISRGKKKKFFTTARGRRNALEEIVKSVKNDPFYIVRGKKDFTVNQLDNSTTQEEFLKTKELICATIELTIMNNNKGKNVKREINEERDRRNILKKLAAQLQNDPYFVSRGKKSEKAKDNEIEEFLSQIAVMCN